MKNYIVYDKNTGEILRTGLCPVSMFSIQAIEPDDKVIEGVANDITQRINIVTEAVVNKAAAPTVIDKTSMLANGIEEATISNLINPSIVTIDRNRYTVTDSTLAFTIDTSGEYTILCESFPYLDKEFTVNAS